MHGNVFVFRMSVLLVILRLPANKYFHFATYGKLFRETNCSGTCIVCLVELLNRHWGVLLVHVLA